MRKWRILAMYILIGRFIYVIWADPESIYWGEYYYAWDGGLLFLIFTMLFYEKRRGLFLLLSMVFGALLLWEIISYNNYREMINSEPIAFWFFCLLICSIIIISIPPLKKWQKPKSG